MCLKYHKPGTRDEYYARLCYLTGRRGEHVDLTSDQVEHWGETVQAFHGQGLSRGARKRVQNADSRLYTITFAVGDSSDDVIEDMARYMDTERYTRDPENGNVTFWVERGVSPNDIRRAESFGWKRAGLL